jgi:hypothetical protein
MRGSLRPAVYHFRLRQPAIPEQVSPERSQARSERGLFDPASLASEQIPSSGIPAEVESEVGRFEN